MIPLTLDLRLNLRLNLGLEDVPLPPDLNHSPHLILNIRLATIVCGCGSIGDELDNETN